MSIDNWINLIAAILVGGGTLTLAYMAWRTIRQTRSIQKAEKRERLLKEIVEWALSTLNCFFTTAIRDLPTLEISTKDFNNMKNHQGIIIGNLEHEFEKVWNRGKYIQKIAPSSYSELREVVNELMDIICENENFCEKYRQNFFEPKNIAELDSLINKWGKESDALCSKTVDKVYKLMDAVAQIETKNLE